MPLTREFVVYKHTNKTNGKVYIGITSQNTEKRWQNGHGYDGTLFGNAISKYGWNGFTHEVIAKGLNHDEACEMEIALISQYGSTERNKGYNVSCGGEVMFPEPKFGADNPKSVSVKRIEPKSGEVVVYQSVADAVKEMGINHRGISKCCRGYCKTYKGYVWEYADGNFVKPFRPSRGKYDHVKQRKRVMLTEPDGSMILFDSIVDAAAYAKTRPNNITRYISGKRNDATQRRWSVCL